MAEKQFNFKFSSGEIANSSVFKSKDGYNYADITLKRGEHYIRISYEWRGDVIPDFAMDVLGYMQMDNKTTANKGVDLNKEISEFKSRLEKVCR